MRVGQLLHGKDISSCFTNNPITHMWKFRLWRVKKFAWNRTDREGLTYELRFTKASLQ